MSDQLQIRGRRATRLAVLVVGLAAVLGATRPVSAQESGPSQPPAGQAQAAPEDGAAPSLVTVGASVTMASAFVWRGWVLGEDPAVQPSAWIKIGPVTVNSWSNTYVPSARKMWYSEHDLSVDYTQEIRGVTLSAGWINYSFHHVTTGRYTNEFYGAIGAGGFLNPKLQVYQDVQEGNGTYASLAVSHEFAVPQTKVTVTPSVSLGYNRHQWTDFTGFSDVTTTATISVPIPIPHLALQPFLGYSCGLDTTVFPRRFYGGVTLAVE